jgi:hypothetical protein
MISARSLIQEIIMTFRILAAAMLVAAASPALAQGIDSKHSPYPASAYSGYASVLGESFVPASATPYRTASAYRYSGQHAGGPADALRR